jgi:phosphoribosylformylglycinamidine cyclo-ligase
MVSATGFIFLERLMTQEDRYRQAGVDIEKGNQFVKNIGPLVQSTHNPSVLTGLGGFSGLFSLESAKGMQEPVLVSATDGVGTKLRIAFLMDKHDTIGIDMVAMCVNDLVVCGAKPLFMLDYFATGKLKLGVAQEVLKGIVEGCRQADSALVGGETAEMPDSYPDGEYDLAGFAVGIVDKPKILDPAKVPSKATLIGLASTGLHSNGFSLVRDIVFKQLGLKVESKVDDLPRLVGEELIEPTRIYVKAGLTLLQNLNLHALAHITGGGLLENLPRVLPPFTKAVIKKDSWPRQPVFEFLKKAGNLSEKEMFRTFNSGIGMVAVVPEDQAQKAVDLMTEIGQKAYVIGELVKNPKEEEQVQII